MIEVSGLSKYYGPIKAVKNINFSISDGEIVGFLGANGAGKSTTLKILSGCLAPTNGKVKINGLNIEKDSLAIRKIIGYLPENNPLYFDMNVYELLKFTANIRNIKGDEFNIALDKVIDQCGLKGVLHKQIGECSKGYKQRVGLAAAMIHDPKILILDEPVSGLDPNQIVEIRKLIKDLGTEKLVLMSSHILQEIQATVNRIIIINKGEIVADGTNEELMSGFVGNTKLTLEIKNAEDETIKMLTEKIPSISLVDTKSHNGSQILQLEYAKDLDPREELFQYAVDSNWVVTEMSPHSVNLESVFRTLTMEDKANA